MRPSVERGAGSGDPRTAGESRLRLNHILAAPRLFLAFVTRRPEILKLFETHVYGGSPAPLQEVSFQVTSSDGRALGGKATRKEVSVDFTGKEDGPSMSIVIFEIESPVEPAIASESPRD